MAYISLLISLLPSLSTGTQAARGVCVECVRFQELPAHCSPSKVCGTRSSPLLLLAREGGRRRRGALKIPSSRYNRISSRVCGDCACAALFNLNYLAVNKAQWDRDRVGDLRSGIWKGLLHCKNEIFISLWIWIEAAELREPQPHNNNNEKGINIYNHKREKKKNKINLAERSSPIEKENDFSMSFIWTVEATLLLPKTHRAEKTLSGQRRQQTKETISGAIEKLV